MASQSPSSSLPATMKAIQYSSTRDGFLPSLRFNTSAPLPPTAHSLAPNTILVQVLTASINPAEYKFLSIPFVETFFVKPDTTPGMDFAGKCVASNLSSPPASTDPKVGDLVFGRLAGPLAARIGSLAEYTVVPRSSCVRLPGSVKVDEAAGVGTAGLTAYQSLVPYLPPAPATSQPPAKPKKVFINGGSGGVGTYGIQIAKAMGSYVVTSCSTSNIALCKDLGADHVIDYKTQDVLAELIKVGGFDLVVDNVQVPRVLYWRSHLFMDVRDGRWMQVASEPAVSDAVFLYKRMWWPALLGGGKVKFGFLWLKNRPEDLMQIAEWMADGKLRGVVEGRFKFDLDGVKEAYERLMTGRARGKVLVEVGKVEDGESRGVLTDQLQSPNHSGSP